MQKVIIYTDGACSGNPGPGGYATLLLSGRHQKELSQGYQRTTNNRMELMAVIAGLEVLTKPCEVTLYSDSRYVVDAITKGWAKNWQARGWKKADKTPAVNSDLWARALIVLATHRVSLHWVRGHADCVENNRCDELAVAASKSPNRLIDEGYENARRSAVTPGLF